MLNSVSFGTKMGVFDRPDLNAPQAFPKPQNPIVNHPPKKEKSHKVLKAVAGVVATAAVVAGALAAGSKFGVFKTDKVGKLLGKVKDASWLQWAKEPAKKALKGLDTAGNFIIDKSKAVYGVTAEYVQKGVDWVKGLLPKKTA